MPVPRRTLWIWIPLGLLSWAGLGLAAIAFWPRSEPAEAARRAVEHVPLASPEPRVERDAPAPPAEVPDPAEAARSERAVVRWQAEHAVRSRLRAQKAAEFDEPTVTRFDRRYGEDEFHGWGVQGVVHEPNAAGVLVAKTYFLFLTDLFTVYGLELDGALVAQQPGYTRWSESLLLDGGNAFVSKKGPLGNRIEAARNVTRGLLRRHEPYVEVPPPGVDLVDRWLVRRPTTETWTIRGFIRTQDGRTRELECDLEERTYAPLRLRLDDEWILGGPSPQ